jgi:hypothetical protein
MSELQRPGEQPPEGNDPPATGGQRLGELHRAGFDLLAAGDAAIRRALSKNSETFLRANRQRGGQ